MSGRPHPRTGAHLVLPGGVAYGHCVRGEGAWGQVTGLMARRREMSRGPHHILDPRECADATDRHHAIRPKVQRYFVCDSSVRGEGLPSCHLTHTQY
jgi:hypothetical protein